MSSGGGRTTNSACGSATLSAQEMRSSEKRVVGNDAFVSPDIARVLKEEDKIDSYIASALSGLSLQERDKAYHEIHGIRDEISETPEIVEQKLMDIETALTTKLDSLPEDSPIRLASELSPQYIRDPKFLIMFLRAEQFEVDKALTRMIAFFEIKKYLFGVDKLVKPIVLGDLSKSDRATLEAGFIQIAPARDSAGRAILTSMVQHLTYEVVENVTRALFYAILASLEDEETQRKGITSVAYGMGDLNLSSFDLRIVSQGSWVISSLPFRVCCVHHCFSDPTFRTLINFSMSLFPPRARARCKVHCGTGLECMYALMSHGIPVKVLPINMMDGAGLKRKHQIQWMKMRKQQEADESGVAARIVVASNLDVLFGRGKKYREHPGNILMVDVLDRYIPEYQEAGIKEKSLIIAKVTRVVVNGGARFLKLDDVVWKEVDEKLAREKVSHSFRTRIRTNCSGDSCHDKESVPITSETIVPSDGIRFAKTKRPRLV